MKDFDLKKYLAENKLLEIENLSDSESIDAINFITDTLKKVTGYEREGTTRYGFTIDEPNGFTVTWRDASDRWTIDLELQQFQAVAYLNIEGRGKIVLDSRGWQLLQQYAKEHRLTKAQAITAIAQGDVK